MPLKVTPLNGEMFRCVVHSETNAREAYIVDVASKFPLGECSCRDWACRKYPEFKKTGKVIPCKHIFVAREFLLNEIIKANSQHNDESGE